MEQLKIFENPEFGKIRTVAIDGEPWLAGTDVAKALGYKNTKDALATHVEDVDKRLLQRSEFATFENHIPKSALPLEFVNGEIPNRGLTMINESGVYSLVFSSKLPTAKKFKHWVTAEVLPSIRKTGGYMTPEAQAQLADILRSQTELLKTQTALAKTVGALTVKVAELEKNRPAVVYAKDPPVVSLTGLAKVIINTRRVLLDRGSSTEDVWTVTRSILNTCGFSVPRLDSVLRLEDFF